MVGFLAEGSGGILVGGGGFGLAVDCGGPTFRGWWTLFELFPINRLWVGPLRFSLDSRRSQRGRRGGGLAEAVGF